MAQMISNYYSVNTSVAETIDVVKVVVEGNYKRVYQPKAFIINVDADSDDFVIKFHGTDSDSIANGMLLKSGIDYYFGDLETPIDQVRIEFSGTGSTAVCTINCFRYIVNVMNVQLI
jgi:hypothetical protein